MQIVNNKVIETSRLVSSVDTDYPYCRIPSIVCTDNGYMFICYECRQASDWSVIDIALRISTDYGKTWSQRKIVANGKGRNSCNNPTLIADGNKLILLFCENYKRVFITESTDFGNSWPEKTEITDTFDHYYWSCVATGPGHGVADADGHYLVPFWFAFNQQDMFSHHPSKAGIMESNGKGSSWNIAVVFDDSLCNPSEISVASLSNGNALANIRNENNEKCRAFSFYNHESKEWSKCELRTDLPDPTCFSGICTCNNSLLLVNCRDVKERNNLSVSVSRDDGRTWTSYLLDKSGGYADICYNKITDTAFVFYETEECRYMRIAEIII